MSKKKNADLASELADLLMEDDESVPSVVDHDPDPTVAISGQTSPAAPTKPVELRQSSPGPVLTAEGALVQSEQLRIAQERILDLESMIDSLRAENEELVAAGETLKNRSDDFKEQLEKLKTASHDKQEDLSEEMASLKSGLASKNSEVEKLRLKIEELELRLQGDLKRIRNRERELENRLELAKLESHAVTKNKDEIILDLKRKIDQLGFELENYRDKSRDLNKMIEDNRERVRRTVKTLRVALSMLEGEQEAEVAPLKKAE